MNRLTPACLFLLCLISGCMPIQSPINNQYTLNAYSKATRPNPVFLNRTLLLSPPEAMAGYQTEQMIYVSKLYERNAFAQSAWVSSPSNMIYPLLIQSFQESNAFNAIASSGYNDKVDYRLDTQLLTLQQNFLVKPSVLEFAVKVVLTRVDDNTVLASKLVRERIVCPSDTPYGGVVAANQATAAFTEDIRRFTIKKIQQDSQFNRGKTL